MQNILILTLITLLTSSIYAQENNWVEFSSSECNFSISTPIAPDVTVDSVYSQGSYIKTIEYSSMSESRVSYRIACSDFPVGPTLRSNRQKFLTLKLGALPIFGGEIVELEDLRLEEHFGISYKENSDMFTIYYQNIIIGDKVLQMSVGGMEHDAKEEAERFYNSMRFE